MRRLITNYSFSASAQQVTLTGVTVAIEKVLMIVNQTDGIVIYDPHTAGAGGTASGSIVTLAYDTTAMSDSDKLLVFYEDDGLISDLVNQTGGVTETAPGTDTASSGLNGRLQRIAQRLTSLIGLLPTSLTGSGHLQVALLEALPTGSNAIGTVEVTKQPKSSSANTPSIGTSAATVISSNSSRKKWGIQNLGTNTLYVRMGANASTTVFHVALAPGAANDDGYGASVSDDTYTGDVSVAGTSPRYTTFEL